MIFLLMSALHSLHWLFFFDRVTLVQDAEYVSLPFAITLVLNLRQTLSTLRPCLWLHLRNVWQCSQASVALSWTFLTLLVPRMRMRTFSVDGGHLASCLHHGILH